MFFTGILMIMAVFFTVADTLVFPNGDVWESAIPTMDAENIVIQIDGGARFNLRRGDVSGRFGDGFAGIVNRNGGL
mgnify:CR=1 FL=1